MVKTESIEALIRLLDDPDEHIVSLVRSKLLDIGPAALEFLRTSVDILDFEPAAFVEIERLMQELQFAEVKAELIDWIKKPEKDLLRGAYLIAKYQFPDLEYHQLNEQITSIEKKVWLELNGKLTSFEIVKTINAVLFDFYGFKGAETHDFSPYHSLLNTVLEEREGTPLSLSILYSIIAQRLEIPIYGVGFPNHFILAYMDEYRIHRLLQSDGSGGVLFYIDPFAKGELLSRGNLEDTLQHYQMLPQRHFFEPSSHSSILIRMINNLIVSYNRLNRTDKVSELDALKKCFIS